MRGPCVEMAARLCFLNLSLVSHHEPFLVGIFFLQIHMLKDALSLFSLSLHLQLHSFLHVCLALLCRLAFSISLWHQAQCRVTAPFLHSSSQITCSCPTDADLHSFSMPGDRVMGSSWVGCLSLTQYIMAGGRSHCPTRAAEAKSWG